MSKFVLAKGAREWVAASAVLDLIDEAPEGHIFQRHDGYANGRLRISAEFAVPVVKGGQHMRRAVMSLAGVPLLEIHELRNGRNASLWHSVILFTHDSVGQGDLLRIIARMSDEAKTCLFAFSQEEGRVKEGEADLVAGFMNNVMGDAEPDPQNMREVNPRFRPREDFGVTIDLEPASPSPLLGRN